MFWQKNSTPTSNAPVPAKNIQKFSWTFLVSEINVVLNRYTRMLFINEFNPRKAGLFESSFFWRGEANLISI